MEGYEVAAILQCEEELDQLEEENKKLKEENNEWKTRLIAVEVQIEHLISLISAILDR